jgi:hypothetical protein
MSYSEKDGEVVLTMSKVDYGRLMFRLGMSADISHWRVMDQEFEFLNRLNSGNPNYTPYQAEEKKS